MAFEQVPKPISAYGSWVRCEVKLSGKTVIITGANTGIGLWTAIDLAKREAKVIIACRNAKKAQHARSKIIEKSGCQAENVVVKVLDLSSIASIRDFAEDINTTEERLDILINNAGIMMGPEEKTADGIEAQFGVNYVGHFLLTNLLLDLLEKSAPSRIVTVSSVAHLLGQINFDDLNSSRDYQPMKAYANSKLSLILFTRQLAKYLKGTGVTANCVHPGIVKTGILRQIDTSAGSLMWYLIFNLTRIPGLNWILNWKTPEHGAQSSIYCAVAPELFQVSGRYFSDCHVTEVSDAAKNDNIAEKLWNVTFDLTRISSKSKL